MSFPKIYLKRNEERRVRRGHPWVFSNEIDIERSPIKQLDPGDMVEVRARDDGALGSGYINPNSLICVRMLGRVAGQVLNRALLQLRIDEALSLRERLFPAPFYRLVYGESDQLPGLVIDRFGDVFVVQIGTAGIERVRDVIVDVLQAKFKPQAVVMRNDMSGRQLEGLDQHIKVELGTLPDELIIEEQDAQFIVQPLVGQKTGWFFDQRPNRSRLHRYCAGKRVLDACSYTGGFGIQAALAGATQVTCIDSSATALEQVKQNAALNRVAPSVETEQGDIFQTLASLRTEKRRFDVVVLDPPALIPRRKDHKSGEEAYRRLNRLALSCLEQDGTLVSSSCSYHLPGKRLGELIYAAGKTEGRRIQILEQGHQGPDHPIHPGMPESEYLHTYVVRAVRL